MFDKDNSGSIATSELYEMLKMVGVDVTEDEVVELMSLYDVDGDATIGFDEFISQLDSKSGFI